MKESTSAQDAPISTFLHDAAQQLEHKNQGMINVFKQKCLENQQLLRQVEQLHQTLKQREARIKEATQAETAMSAEISRLRGDLVQQEDRINGLRDENADLKGKVHIAKEVKMKRRRW